MVDLHCHILPGIDDGAADLTESCAMLDDAAANQVDVLVATPHFEKCQDWTKVTAALASLEPEAQKRKITLRLGTEYNFRNLPLPDDATPITLGRITGGTLLLDFRSPFLPGNILNDLDEFRGNQYRLVIAHPERTFSLAQLPCLRGMRETGIFFQVTASSVAGHYGKSIQRFAWQLLEENLAVAIASDAHGAERRSSHLLEAMTLIGERYGSTAVQILQQNAAALLTSNGVLQPFPEMPRRSIWSRLWRWN